MLKASSSDDHDSYVNTAFPKIIVPRLCGYCGGVADSIISIFIHFDRSGFNVEFETLFDLI